MGVSMARTRIGGTFGTTAAVTEALARALGPRGRCLDLSRGVRRVLVPWPLPAEERPALRALRAAGIEIVAIATSPSAFEELEDLAKVARVLVAPEPPRGPLPLGLTVVWSGLPARLGSEGITAFIPAALHDPFPVPQPR